MRHLRTRLTIAVAAVTVGALLTMPAGAHEIVINDTVFDGAPTVTVDGSAASVSGLAIFGGERAKTLVTDPVGDDRVAEASAVTATDLTAAKLSQPEPIADELLFQLDTAGAIPVVNGTPEVVQYNWDIAVDGGAAAGGSNWSIKAMRSSLYHAQSTDAWAVLSSCVMEPDNPTGGFTCTNVHTFEEVEFERSGSGTDLGMRLRVFVPFDVIGATPGSTIEAWARSTNPIWTGPSASGRLTLTNFFDTIGFHAPYTVPVGGVVHLAAGQTDDPDALDWREIAVDELGNFSGAIELAPEDTVIGVRACFSDNCAYYFTARG